MKLFSLPHITATTVLVCSFLAFQPALAACPSNSERWYDKGTLKCRCVYGYIVNRGQCVVMNVYNARVRAQELKQTKRSSCLAMAQTYNEFSWAVGFNSRLLSNYVREILGNEHSSYFVDHNDGGFRSIYQDGSNQVRHFTVYFQVGVLFSSDKAAWPATYLTDYDSRKDRDLAKLAASIGKQMSASNQQMKYIGETIRSRTCRNR